MGFPVQARLREVERSCPVWLPPLSFLNEKGGELLEFKDVFAKSSGFPLWLSPLGFSQWVVSIDAKRLATWKCPPPPALNARTNRTKKQNYEQRLLRQRSLRRAAPLGWHTCCAFNIAPDRLLKGLLKTFAVVQQSTGRGGGGGVVPRFLPCWSFVLCTFRRRSLSA